MRTLRLTSTVAAVAAAGLLLSGCGGSSDDTATAGAAGATTITVKLTDQGCAPTPSSAPAGSLTFEITNDGANRVTEAEVMRDGSIIGEKENLTPGLSGSFTLRLDAGEYSVQCPNAAKDTAPFTVTAGAGESSATTDAALSTSVDRYEDYVQKQSATLLTDTSAFVAAVKAGDIAKAKALYAPTRASYERIEPVAESFGDLDPRIDARENDVDPGDRWTGFHRLEKALWHAKSLKGTGPVADQLLADVKSLNAKVKTVSLQPAQIANGSVGLLDEVAKSKITGEEERYSHTDLWDFAANVAGAREAVDVLAPTLRQKDAALLKRVDTQFDAVMASLAKYQTKDGYRDYSAVTDAERRTMTTQVNALAESLSKIAPLIAS